MLRAGAILLSLWAGMNLVLATFILVMVVLFRAHPLIARVVFTDAELAALSSKTAATIKGLAVLFNSLALAFSVLVLVVAWTGLAKGERWAFWGLLATVGVAQAFGFVADAYIGNKTLFASIALTVLYLVAMAISWLGLSR